MKEESATQEIDAIIKNITDWRGEKLSYLRQLIITTDPQAIEEVKWKLPSKPQGVPVWSHGGIISIADTLKNAIRLTFPKGASLPDPQKLFNTRLDSKSVRAIDFHQNEAINTDGLKTLIIETVKLNSGSHREP